MGTRASFICVFYPTPFFTLPPTRTVKIRVVPSYRRCDIKYQMVRVVVSILILCDAQRLDSDTIRAVPVLFYSRQPRRSIHLR